MNNETVKDTTVSIEIYIDGSGSKPDGTGSGFAWLQPKNSKSEVHWKNYLTNNQAEYNALLSAITALPEKVNVIVYTDSLIVCEQFNGRYKVRDFALSELLQNVKNLILEKQLTVIVKWISRDSNYADKLLKKNGNHKAENHEIEGV